jgi:molybdate transport system substrate-binding protein
MKPEAELMKRFLVALLCLVAASSRSWTQAKSSQFSLLIAAAADLNPALNEIGRQFENRYEVGVKLSFGASGALTQQIQNGAPFDLFFSADMDYPRQLIAQGHADSSSLYEYSLGKLVLWVPANSPLDLEHRGLATLLDPSIKKIAIANAQYAPYGRAAVAALKHAGLYERLVGKFVIGENISQTAQFVESGNAQAGFIALAHALSPKAKGTGKFWIVPADYYPPLEQGAVIVASSQHKKEATEFLKYLKSAEASQILRAYGFAVPKN